MSDWLLKISHLKTKECVQSCLLKKALHRKSLGRPWLATGFPIHHNRFLSMFFFLHIFHQILQAVLHLHGSLTTRFSKYITWFILVLSFVHLVLNHSSAYTVFCLHGCFSKVLKNRVSRGPSVWLCIFLFFRTKFC